MRRLRIWIIVTSLLVPAIARTADAQKRIILFEIDPANSEVRMEGTAFADIDGDGDEDELPLFPQKTGPENPENNGRSSDYADWSGTLEAIVDLSTSRIQITGGGNLIPESNGIYCPGDDPEDEECPDEDPGQYAYRLGAPGGGSVEAAVRGFVGDMNGVSPITGGTQIDTENWHLFMSQVFAHYDSTGALEDFVGNGSEEIDERDTPGHNERREDDVLPPDLSGFLDIDVPQQSAFIQFPIHGTLRFSIPGADVQLAFTGQLTGEGDLGEMLIDGDANRDGQVDGIDVNIISRHWGRGLVHPHDAEEEEESEGHPLYAVWYQGDFNMDGVAGPLDMAILVNNFGTGGGSGGGIPEPSSGLLAMLAAAGLLVRRLRY